MTTTLLNDDAGRNILLIAQRQHLKDRLSRFFRRNIQIDYDNWAANLAEFDLPTTVDDLNDHHDTELRNIYSLLGSIGGLQESITSSVIYVNPTTGSDTTGTGSSLRPYASLWFLPWIPRVIKHNYYILIQGNLNLGGRLDVNCTIAGEYGSLNFIGVGNAVQTAAGGTITATNVFQNAWRELDLSVPPAASAVQSFLRISGGVQNLYAAPVNRVDPPNSRLWVRYNPLDGIAGNEDYTYVEPAVTLTIQGGTISVNGSRDLVSSGTNRGSRVNFANLIIDLDNQATSQNQQFVTEGVPMGFWFCQMKVTSNVWDYPIVFRNDINRWSPKPDANTIRSMSNCLISNLVNGSNKWDTCGLQILNRDATEFGAGQPVLLLDGSPSLYSVDCMGQMAAQRSAYIRTCSVKTAKLRDGVFRALNFTADPNNAAQPYCIDLRNGSLHLSESLFGKANLCGIWVFAARFLCDICGGDAAATMSAYSYGAYISGGGMMSMNAWQGTRGTVGNQDVYWVDTALDSVFPGAAAQVVDGIGSYCMRWI